MVLPRTECVRVHTVFTRRLHRRRRRLHPADANRHAHVSISLQLLATMGEPRADTVEAALQLLCRDADGHIRHSAPETSHNPSVSAWIATAFTIFSLRSGSLAQSSFRRHAFCWRLRTTDVDGLCTGRTAFRCREGRSHPGHCDRRIRRCVAILERAGHECGRARPAWHCLRSRVRHQSILLRLLDRLPAGRTAESILRRRVEPRPGQRRQRSCHPGRDSCRVIARRRRNAFRSGR